MNPLVFQFHKGTIRTHSSFSFPKRNVLFQFHKGTIRTQYWAKKAEQINAFQFHKGTIRTHFSECRGLRTQISIP